MPRLLSRAALLCLCCAAVGCGEKQLPTVPVEGVLYLDDKPYGPVQVGLAPVDPAGHPAGATTKEDGSFVLTTYDPGDGAPEGEYTVMLTADPMSGKLIPPVEEYRVTVKKADSGPQKLEIKLKSVGMKNKPGYIPPPR